MGWLFGWNTKVGMQAEITQSLGQSKYKILAEETVGKNWWLALEHPQGYRFIALYLMDCEGSSSWGYKDLDESCGPVQVNCPLHFLELAMPAPPGRYVEAWRARVRAHHAS